MKNLRPLIVVLALTACGSDPYDGKTTVAVGSQKVSQEAPPPPPPPPPPPEPRPLPSLSLAVADTMAFQVGTESTYSFTALANPGPTQVQIDNLPTSMVFDPLSQTLKWKPEPDPVNPRDKRIIPIDIHVRSGSEPRNALSKTVLLVVNPAGN